MKYILVIFFAAILMISNSAKAIIHGENIIANTVSTVNLNIKHQHYLRSSNPVSYTHLDVYKRQVSNLPSRLLGVAKFISWMIDAPS